MTKATVGQRPPVKILEIHVTGEREMATGYGREQLKYLWEIATPHGKAQCWKPFLNWEPRKRKCSVGKPLENDNPARENTVLGNLIL